MKRLTLTLVAAVSVLCLSGCLAIGGSPKTTAVQPTTGQQLLDLKRALDCGALTPKEYEAQKSKVLCR